MGTVLDYMEQYCEAIEPKDFYRIIFPKGELDRAGAYNRGKYVAIAVGIQSKKKIKRYTVLDELEAIEEMCATDDFCLMSPISYAGKSRKSENARYLYAIAIDVDGIRNRDLDGYPEGIQNLFYQFDGNGPSNYLPKPTALVMSGTGIHVYYVLEQAIPLYPNIVKEVEKLKRRLTWMLWTQGVTDLVDNVQYESLFQGFRVPGTITKSGKRARAYLVDKGKKVTIEYLNSFVPEQYRAQDFAYKSKLTLREAAGKYPDWYERRVVEKQPRGTWLCNEGLYQWWLQKIYEGAEDGHRYWCVFALAVYARKCGIDYDRLIEDALGLINFMNERGKREDNPFTVEDVQAAVEAYNDSYITYPRRAVEYHTGIKIPENKRNGRSQELHLRIARANKKILKEAGEVKDGRPTKEKLVLEYIKQHPENHNVAAIARECKVSRNTVYKYLKKE